MGISMDLSDEWVLSYPPPFEARDKDGIIIELGLSNSPHRRLMEPLAFAVEVGNYPRLQEIVRICASHVDKNRLTDDAALMEAVRRFEEAASLGLCHEQLYGPCSARNTGHRFWPEVWERDAPLRERGGILCTIRPGAQGGEGSLGGPKTLITSETSL